MRDEPEQQSEAGVSKGLLWHYFADGDDLMEQTARVTLVTLRETVASDIDLSAEAPHIIRAAIRRAAAGTPRIGLKRPLRGDLHTARRLLPAWPG
jgi:AcrR family transcriptional regulator